MKEIISRLWKDGFFIDSNALKLLSKISDYESFVKFLSKKSVKIITAEVIEEYLSSIDYAIPKSSSSNNTLPVQKLHNSTNTKDSKVRILRNNKKSNDRSILSFLSNSKSNNTDRGLDKGIISSHVKKNKQTTDISSSNVSNANIRNPGHTAPVSFENNVVSGGTTLQIIHRRRVTVNSKSNRRVSSEIDLSVKVLKNYERPFSDVTVANWAAYFRARLRKARSILRAHGELRSPISLDILKGEMDDVSLVGIVRDRREVSKGLLVVLEDVKGKVKVFVPNSYANYDYIREIPLDSVIGVTGSFRGNMFYAEEVILPDIPLKERKTSKEEVYVVYTGDFQIGNKVFLKDAFERFIGWLKGEYGNEKMKELARKVGYVVITGDIADGVGIYPGQEEELEIKDIYGQYEAFEKYMLELPEDLQVIMIPGNHDAVRLAEPQPPIPRKYLPELYQLDNFYILSNPSYVKLHNILDVLIYHGYSMDWFVSNVSWIREQGGYENAGAIMRYMLSLRHLAPQHGSTPYIPFPHEDPEIIDLVPNVFVTGHIHRTYIGNYKNVTLINASCFQGMTKFQQETGHKPDPGKIIIHNLKEDSYKILSFL